MRKRKKGKIIRITLFTSILIGCVNQLSAQSVSPEPREDNQFWSETQMIMPLHKKADLILIGVFRAGRDFRHPVDERIGAGIALKLHKYVTLTPTYLYVAQQPSEGRKNFEHRLIPNVTIKFPIGQFNITDRNLFEWRVRHSLRDIFIYRNRLQIDHPARIGSFDFRVFMADEVFYSADLEKWVRNRISAGIIKKLNERLTAEFFYLNQQDGIARPGNLHVIGTVFKVYL
jgi:hypothetical protein